MNPINPDDSPEARLAAVRVIAREAMKEANFGAWRFLQIVDQLCMGTITVDQALRQAED